MPKQGKRYDAASKAVEKHKRYSLDEAINLVKNISSAKFKETVDIAVRLNVDPRHADQMVRGTVVLPHGTGKTNRVLVFAEGDLATEAQDAGADYVGSSDLADKIQGGWLDFDVAIASPDMMAVVGKLGRVLGPRGLMPNPKTGTVTKDIAKAVTDSKGGKIQFRVDRAGNIHAPVGKAEFEAAQLKENIKELVLTLIKLRPAAVKGRYLKSITISSTMGPGIKVELSEFTT